METLTTLARHNAWANARLFDACAAVPPAQLADDSLGYGSILGILSHLVGVEHAFFELAHGREPQRLETRDLAGLREACSRIDQAYIEYAETLQPAEAETGRFLVPWFGFELTLAEGILQPLTHSHKHRADVSMILPLLGGAGIEMDLIQWLAAVRSG